MAYLLTAIWIFIQGYRVLTGQLRESLMGLVANMARAVFIVAVATSFGAANDTITQFLTVDMKAGIHELITGHAGQPEDEIDSNLGWLQVAMSSMDVLDSGGDLDGAAEKERAAMWLIAGTGGPPVVAGALLLMYQVAMALFIGLGPLFILCLLFDYTKSLFQKWLFYGIGTMFSMAVLSAMVSIALKMVSDVAMAMWASDALTTLFMDGGTVGYSSRAMQTGGMGLILTVLLITVPPMAAMFFNGTLGTFGAYATMGPHLEQGMGQPQRGAYSGGGQYGGGYRPEMPGSNTSGGGSFTENRTATYSGTPNYAASGAGGTPIQESVKTDTQAPHRDHAGRVAPVGTTDSGYVASQPPSQVARNSPPAQTSGPTNTPPPPPKDDTPRRS